MGAIASHLPDLLLAYSAFALAVASPGPSTLAIMATSMERGRGTGLTLASGVTAGSFTWGLLATAGVATVLAAHGGALYAIKIAGAAYLLFLAWKAGRSAARRETPLPDIGFVGPQSAPRVFARGYLMHLTNPKAILGWIAIIALGLRPNAPSAVILTLLLGCLGISLFFNCGYALLFSTEPLVHGYRKARRWIEGSLSAFFVFASYKLLTSKP